MTYAVIWRKAAEDDFKKLWTHADDPGMILNAARRIESKLQRVAHIAGEGRHKNDSRVIFEPPLGVAFWVSEIDRVATVNAVWRTD